MKVEFSRQKFDTHCNINFHENSSSGSRVVAYGQTDRQTHGPADTMKLIVAFRNYANGPKNRNWRSSRWFLLECSPL